ncbi:biotin synthase [Candidatus Nitrososphaera gargensis Ga9.2]|uniref:Biotin synthase n=1 Tax=Nitrososphaera gargensis (strain Ga9.2) TaxID=1237085 RepID=K0IFX1_NITGG|nr:biotin synthase BioB [Candidatus Nitrososphaera gargensis]AFU58690.1 biotin synthase [Candidatus Nitrososphaera gargensis Ga9.2]
MMADSAFIRSCTNKVLAGGSITFEEAERLLATDDVMTLAGCANTITRTFNGDTVDVEALINAKSGRCPEDCSFCAQSSFYDTGITKYPLLPKEVLVENARKAKEAGATSFCLVCAYREPPEKDFQQICETIAEIRSKVDIEVNVSLGFMTPARARRLRELGVKRYNHNLEAAESYFSKICKTHDFADRVNTAKIVKEAGLELCSGGIIGMGESKKERLDLAFSLASLRPDEVPINILIGREGTPMAGFEPIDPLEAIKTIAVWRFIMPKTILKIAGGREVHLKDKDRLALKAGANGIITGGYLTTGGNAPNKDIAMIKEIGLKA